MPVTARLSRAFYDRLGEDVANELVEWFNAVDATYRADLRQLNELNYARFDARVGERFSEIKTEIAEFRAEMEARFARMQAEMDARFASADAKSEQRVGSLVAELKGELRSETARVRADLIKWMFVFVATATLAVLGLG